MGYPRRLQVPPDVSGVYHCVSRCVRRAFLCGNDPLTGKSFEHRKRWIECRIEELAELFAVSIHAYAVMSNHVHVVIEIDPNAPRTWSDDDVARRWFSALGHTGPALDTRVSTILVQPERLAVVRGRLGSLSWFMRCLKEPIARRANREDDCTGRFWEGRFSCQALLDDPSVLGCMVYVDLNPFRAGVARSPARGSCTSVRRRIRACTDMDSLMCPVAGSLELAPQPLTTAQYVDLVNWTGRSLHRTTTLTPPPPALSRLNQRPRQWLIQVPATESQFWRVIGTAESIAIRARELGRQWLCGIEFARSLRLRT